MCGTNNTHNAFIESYNYDQIVSSNNSLYDDSRSTDMSLSQFYLTF